MNKVSEFEYKQLRGGKNTLWVVRHPSSYYCGSGNSPENARRDFLEQLRRREKDRLHHN